MKSLIIFAGAGASRGVSEQKYPMALDFRKRLPDSVKTNPLYKYLISHLESNGPTTIDIEHVLWELQYLSEGLSEWTDSRRFAANLLATNQIVSATGHQVHGPQTQQQFGALANQCRSLQDQINECVYEFYSQPPSTDEIQRSWAPLLKYVEESHFERIDIVTTNYDLVIEAALDDMPSAPVSMGFQQGLYPGIDLRVWRDNDTSRRGLLTKLHGSVDWKLGNGGTDAEPVIRRGHPEFDGDHRKRLILYPGFKGTPSREPFVAFHEYFRQRLLIATHMLFVGFAFRDEFINQLIDVHLPKSAKIAVVNPATDLPNLGFLKGVTHLAQGFGMPSNSALLTSGGVKPLSLRELNEWRE